MGILKAFFLSALVVLGFFIACKDENNAMGSQPAVHQIPGPAADHVPDPFPPKGYILTSSLEADASITERNYSTINNYMKNFGFEYSEHPNCTGGYG